MTDSKDPRPDAEEAMPEEEATRLALEPAPAARPRRQGGFLPAVAGGALAALAGFGLSHFNAFGFRAEVDVNGLSAELSKQAADLAALRSDLEGSVTRFDSSQAALTGRADGLESNLAALSEAKEAALADLDKRIAAIEAFPADGDASTAAVAAALSDLERRVTALGSGGAALPANIEAKLDAAMEQLAAAEAKAAEEAAKAETTARIARQRAAVDQLRAALESGAAFSGVLADLPQDQIAPALRDSAATGFITLKSLQDSFPDAARTALQVAWGAKTEEGWGARLTDFLQAQTGARSLTPREGADPDAVLSRAEAALREGRLAASMAELQTLDPAIRAPLDDWIALATKRIEAETAVAALAAAIEG
jgi:hypothetical protein